VLQSGAKPTEKPRAFRIDFEGLQYRILDLPIQPGTLRNLQVGAEGHVYYLRRIPVRILDT